MVPARLSRVSQPSSLAQAFSLSLGERSIHGDFERGFIAVETISYDDYLACGGELGAKEAGRMRVEGRDYVVRDGDVIHFRFNV